MSLFQDILMNIINLVNNLRAVSIRCMSGIFRDGRRIHQKKDSKY